MSEVSKVVLALGLASATWVGPAHADVGDLTGQGYFTYGNTNVYDLPILAYQYDLANGGGTGPGNPYYVTSTPGAIKDLVVIYTGASGTGVQTNAQGFENSYLTPSGSEPVFASTNGAINVVAPAGTKDIKTQFDSTWDANLYYLKNFLNGGNALFLFNNNETNSDPNLAIWAKLWITDVSGNVYNNRHLYLSNENQVYGTGGTPLGDATTYNPGDVQPAVDRNTFKTDYVLSGSQICLDKTTGQTAPCGANTVTINNNLGANQVAYAGDVPLLDTWLAALFGSDDDVLKGFSLHLQLNLGCDPAWNNANNCANLAIDNGYEQLFLASTNSSFINVPEPDSIALLGIGLLGLAGWRRRRIF